eukprot:TRINITY_DN111679_c0_g1_i1.p1 TRINITY_DN111679_c0_g1~~TRINITY_DN111679_c0_g1_i1.p1  ORF type:complete len:583 (-),score=123.67 TRINITY_DN111679_c0_g1_i1:610-2358(-)
MYAVLAAAVPGLCAAAAAEANEGRLRSLLMECPPAPATRRPGCLRVDARALGNRFQDADASKTADNARGIFGHAAAVLSVLNDIIEAAPAAPTQEAHAMLNFFDDVIDITCLLKFEDCYDRDAYEGLMTSLCIALGSECARIDRCMESVPQAVDTSIDAWFCERMEHFHVALEFMAWKALELCSQLFGEARCPIDDELDALLTRYAETAMNEGTTPLAVQVAEWWRLGGLRSGCPKEERSSGAYVDVASHDVDLNVVRNKDSVVAAQLRRVTTLGGLTDDLKVAQRQVLRRGRAYELLGELWQALPEASRLVIDLGAGAEDTAATCLAERGWSGILFEVDEERLEPLRSRFSERQDVAVVGRVVEPKDLPSHVLAELATMGSRPPEHTLPFPALLKIDVDNGDCDYLEAWMASGYRPLFLHMEVIHSFVPPSLQVNFPFNPIWIGNATEQYRHAHFNLARGCSLGAILERLKGEYALLSWSATKPADVEFVHAEWAQQVVDIGPVLPMTAVEPFWQSMVSLRERWEASNWHALELDVRQLWNDMLSLEEKEQLLRDAYELQVERLKAENGLEVGMPDLRKAT